MATASNSVFFEVVSPPLQLLGWEVRVLSHLDFTTLIAVIPRFSQLIIGPELSAAGTGSITIDLDDELFKHNLSNGDPSSSLLDDEHLWCAYQDGILRFQWFGEVVVEAEIQEDGARPVTVSGPGIGSCLSWAQVFPADFPQQSTVITDPTQSTVNGPTTFPLQPIFACFGELIREAQKRGTISMIHPMFSDTADSGGVLWADTNWTDTSVLFVPTTVNGPTTYTPTLWTPYLDLLTSFSGQDPAVPTTSPIVVDWYMWPGFQLDVRQTFGSRLSDRVIFHQSGSARAIQRTRIRTDVRNLVVIRDDVGDYSIASNDASIASFHQRELGLSPNMNNLNSQVIRAQVASLTCETTDKELSSWTISVDTATPGRRPFYDYNIGDWVGAETSLGVVEEFRVQVIALSIDQDGAETCELTLETKLAFLDKQLLKRITTLEYTNNNGLPILPPPVSGVNTGPGQPGGEITPIGSGIGAGTGTGTGTGTGGGVKVFIQPTDPGSLANIGDFWLKT